MYSIQFHATNFSFRRNSFGFGFRKRRQTDDGLDSDAGDTEVATRPQTRTVRVPGQCYVYTQTFSIGWVRHMFIFLGTLAVNIRYCRL